MYEQYAANMGGCTQSTATVRTTTVTIAANERKTEMETDAIHKRAQWMANWIDCHWIADEKYVEEYFPTIATMELLPPDQVWRFQKRECYVFRENQFLAVRSDGVLFPLDNETNALLLQRCAILIDLDVYVLYQSVAPGGVYRVPGAPLRMLPSRRFTDIHVVP